MYQTLDILTDDERRLVETTPEEGFLSDFVSWASKKTDAPVYSLQSAGLMALSLAAGDTVVLPNFFGSKPIHMNLYILLIGPSTTMRKTTVLNYVMDIVPKNAQTDQHYIKVLDDVSTQAFNKAAAEAGKTMSPLVFNVDEVAGLFGVVKRQGSYLKGLDAVLLKCYDHTPVVIKRTNAEIEAPRGAFTNVFAASTPEPLMEVLGSDDVESGLLPRFLVFDARDAMRGERRSLMERMANREDWAEEAEGLKEFLYEVAKDRANGTPIGTTPDGLLNYKVTEIPFSPEAIVRLDEIDAIFSKEAGTDPSGWGAIKGRGFWHMVKLSGLFALSRDGIEAEVQLIDVLRAVQLVESTIADLGRMQDEVGANAVERNINEVISLLDRSRSRAIPQELVANHLKLTARDLGDLRNTLMVRGLITIDKDEQTGAIHWRKT